jgi:hypothetical protein
VTLGATKPAKSKAPKVRAPEEVWYDVHKHPEGVPGGMGKSPEHHLRGRGWTSHEINGSTNKTIQYHNHKYPDFVISYGGGSAEKPDHNFRVLYLGTNHHVPKVNRAYSVAEAMNKVEELHQLHNGLVVQPMTHGAAQSQQKQPAQPVLPSVPPPAKPRDMTKADAYPQFPDQPEKGRNWWNPEHGGVKEIPEPPQPKPTPPPLLAPTTTTTRTTLKYGAGPARSQNDHGTLAGRNRHAAVSEVACPLCRKAGQLYNRDPGLYREVVKHSGGLTDDHLHTTSQFHDRIQEALTPRVGKPPRHPEGQGPADLGRVEYQRQWRAKQRASDDADVAQLARGYGMHIEPDEVSNYRGLRRVVSALQRSAQETWEEPKDYYHGTTEEDLSEVSPATNHRRGVIFPHQTDPEYGYATPSESNAWHYAELAWNATDHGIPRVYRVRPTGPIEEDPTHWPNGESRGNFSDDVRSRHPFEVHEELPTPEHWQRDEEDWH